MCHLFCSRDIAVITNDFWGKLVIFIALEFHDRLKGCNAIMAPLMFGLLTCSTHAQLRKFYMNFWTIYIHYVRNPFIFNNLVSTHQLFIFYVQHFQKTLRDCYIFHHAIYNLSPIQSDKVGL